MSTTDENRESVEVAKPRRRFARLATLLPLLLAVIAVFVIRARWFSESSQAAPDSMRGSVSAIAARPQTTSAEPENPDLALKRKLLGSWRDDYYGERTMTFTDDGTGTMLIKLDSVGQAIYGESLLFYLAWIIRDGVMEMKFTGGEPKGAVETISKLWGDTHLQAIEVLTESDLHLRSTDSQNLYTLKRVKDEAM